MLNAIEVERCPKCRQPYSWCTCEVAAIRGVATPYSCSRQPLTLFKK